MTAAVEQMSGSCVHSKDTCYTKSHYNVEQSDLPDAALWESTTKVHALIVFIVMPEPNSHDTLRMYTQVTRGSSHIVGLGTFRYSVQRW